MSRWSSLVRWLVVALWVLPACAPAGTPEPTPGPTSTPIPVSTEAAGVATAEPGAGEAATAEPEVEATATVAPQVGGADTVETEADRDAVFTLRAGQRQALPAPQQAFLEVGDGVDVDAGGRAILRFADLLTVEVLREGQLVLQELAADEQSAFITVLQNGGTLINDFNPQEQIDRRFTVETGFAVITATGTRFVVVREANSPLEWIVGLESEADDLQVTADGVTKPVATGVARWIAPVGAPSAGISADMQNVYAWIDGLRGGVPQPEIGELVWLYAYIVADTAGLAALPPPGEPFDLASGEQGAVVLTLDPSRGSYDLQDCNGDGVRDIAFQAGKVYMDFRSVLARVRALDVTVLNRTQPGSGSLRVLDPGQGEIASQRVDAGPGQVQILSLRSDQPYHYAELEMRDGCFLGLSLTPPTPAGEPVAFAPLAGWERPPENGRLQASPLAGANGYDAVIEIDGAPADWDALAQLSGVDWTELDTVVYDTACANRYPSPAPGGPTDLGGRVRLAYDATYLYVAFLVDDDGYVGYSGADQRYFLGDAPQLSLDTDLPGDLSQGALSQDDLQVDLHPGLEVADVPDSARAALWQLGTLRSREWGEARVAALPTGSGYFLEAALPWTSLGLPPLPGARLGLAASVSDNDTPGTDAQECMISTAPQRDWQDPTTWGTLLLGPPPGW